MNGNFVTGETHAIELAKKFFLANEDTFCATAVHIAGDHRLKLLQQRELMYRECGINDSREIAMLRAETTYAEDLWAVSFWRIQSYVDGEAHEAHPAVVYVYDVDGRVVNAE